MNLIAAIILITVIADFALQIVADLLNLKMLNRDLPQPFQGVYDADRYGKSQDYLRANTQFGWIVSTFSLLLLLVFWFGRGFPLLDSWVRSWDLPWPVSA